MQSKCRRTRLSRILEHNCETDKASRSSQSRGQGQVHRRLVMKRRTLTGAFRAWDGFRNAMERSHGHMQTEARVISGEDHGGLPVGPARQGVTVYGDDSREERAHQLVQRLQWLKAE